MIHLDTIPAAMRESIAAAALDGLQAYIAQIRDNPEAMAAFEARRAEIRKAPGTLHMPGGRTED